MNQPRMNTESHGSVFFIRVLCVFAVVLFTSTARSQPTLVDDRLELKLFAEDPEIVTPIGIAIDSEDRIFVLESHTHSAPPDYDGPDGDIIKVFADVDGDGVPEKRWNFADGIEASMNLAFSRDGDLYVCAAREVLAFRDTDGDLVADERKVILRVETDNLYPHSCQMGIAFSSDGWMYVSRGNNGGKAYTVHGTDGSSISGFGDGGSVYRCRADGTKLEEFATGFWNSMDLKFDSNGRLLLVDNDPDARGPNRVVHVVHGGDYGYKSIFGGGGNHPFQGWDGMLPGTLPFAAPIGEAPCGIIDTDRTSLPSDQRGQYLATVWNENSIVRYEPVSSGSSFTATPEPWMQGGQDFRPVAMEADSRGNLYVTDWVLVNYPNHGRGRIWRISTRDGVEATKPIGYFDREPDAGMKAIESTAALSSPGDIARLRSALEHGDPFLAYAAVTALARSPFHSVLPELATDRESKIRLGALLAMRRAGLRDGEILKRFLRDPSENVRQAALMWIGEEGVVELAKDLRAAIEFPDVSSTLFESYLAACETLDPEFINARAAQRGAAGRIPRRLDSSLIESIVRDEAMPDRVRALAIGRLATAHDSEVSSLLRKLTSGSSPILRLAAVRGLGAEPSADHARLFVAIAKDSSNVDDVRAEALLALATQPFDQPEALLPLLHDAEHAVRMEALRVLRFHVGNDAVRNTLIDMTKALGADVGTDEVIETALGIIGTAESKLPPRPATLDEWLDALGEGGDAAAGERVFFSPRTMCASCHVIDGRGRRIGPELSNIGQSLRRSQIIQGIVRPSDQFAPQYQAWFVELHDGSHFSGLQLDHKSGGDIELFTTDGVTRHFEGEDIAGYGVLPNSLMPDGLDHLMTVGELRDLVAFLVSLD